MAAGILAKWGPEVAERGFTQVPNYLLLINQFIDPSVRLGAVELMVLIQLVGAWWHRDDLPFPSMKTLALRSGVSERQVQRTIKQLEALHLVERVKRGQGLMTSNAYNLMPLVRLLTHIAKVYGNDRPRRITSRSTPKSDRSGMPRLSEAELLEASQDADGKAPRGRSVRKRLLPRPE